NAFFFSCSLRHTSWPLDWSSDVCSSDLRAVSVSRRSFAQALPQQANVSTPTPRDWSRSDPVQYPDPDVVALDNRFRRYIVGNTEIGRASCREIWLLYAVSTVRAEEASAR